MLKSIKSRDYILDSSLVLYLPLWKRDGTSFISDDAYGHLCTVTGAVWRPYGRYFDGNGDVVSVANHAALNPTEAITVMAWVNHESLITTERAIVAKYGAAGQRSWFLSWSAARTRWEFTIEGSGVGAYVAGGIVDTWFHIAGTYNRVTHKIYQNGTIGTNADSSVAIPVSTADVEIGDNANLGNYDLIGSIGEVLIYNRALTAQEIQNIYLSTRWRYQ